jgi:RNA recognition motif-containing protein
MSATNDFQSSVVAGPECGQRKGVYPNNVYVKNLPQEFRAQDLKELFSRFGPIVSVKVEMSVLGNSKCFGYVSFEETSDAKTAIR